MGQCCSTVFNVRPALTQHWVNVWYMLSLVLNVVSATRMPIVGMMHCWLPNCNKLLQIGTHMQCISVTIFIETSWIVSYFRWKYAENTSYRGVTLFAFDIGWLWLLSFSWYFFVHITLFIIFSSLKTTYFCHRVLSVQIDNHTTCMYLI